MELAEKNIPGVQTAVRAVGGVVQAAVESGVVEATVGQKAVGAQMVELAIENDTVRDYMINPVGSTVSWLAGD